jgi:uncharacterized membrane protein YeaQ/YmgE (transglycosylase-associated protein family)
MNLMFLLAVGGLIGWFASIFLRHPESVLMDMVTGVAGAVVAGFLLWLGVGGAHTPAASAAGLLVPVLGAILLLTISHLLRRGAFR